MYIILVEQLEKNNEHVSRFIFFKEKLFFLQRFSFVQKDNIQRYQLILISENFQTLLQMFC